MKNTRKCPKCGNQDILLIKGFAGPHYSGNNIPVGMSILSAVKVNRYVCCRCGYSEEWIAPEDISRLKSSRNAIQL